MVSPLVGSPLSVAGALTDTAPIAIDNLKEQFTAKAFANRGPAQRLHNVKILKDLGDLRIG